VCGAALAERVAAVRETIAAAARRAGRDPSAVRIVAVTKTFPPAVVTAALAAGLEDVGENYVQEARAKRRAVGSGGTWHLIGGLQRNKVRAAVATFDWVQTVDSAALARALAAEAARAKRRLPVLLQVNVTGEPSRRGVRPEAVVALAREVLAFPALRLEGLMAIPPADLEAERRRLCFRSLRELRARTQDQLGVELPHLSMGMSDDFAIAIEEGATMVRLGRALFGPRGPGSWREGS
jgi:pyridoxal phosphate enzyme (YggS family)